MCIILKYSLLAAMKTGRQ